MGGSLSNRLIQKIVEQIPLRWDAKTLGIGNQEFDVATHVPVAIYPNPLYPSHYVVLNSGFTYREYDYLNNARQGPKLPDWAIIDTRIPASTRSPGGISAAGFFGERWEVSSSH